MRETAVAAAFFLAVAAVLFTVELPAEPRTIETFPEDTDIDLTGSYQGEPVYRSVSHTEFRPYYRGETYGRRYESLRKPRITDGEVTFVASKNNRSLLLRGETVIANTSEPIVSYEMLNGTPVYLKGGYGDNKTLYMGEQQLEEFENYEDMEIIDGDIAVLAARDHEDYLWYGGQVVDRNASGMEVIEYRGKPAYRTREDLEYGLSVEGEPAGIEGSVRDFRVIQGELAVSLQNGTRLLGNRDVSRCRSINELEYVDGKPACTVEIGNTTMISYQGDLYGQRFESAFNPFEINGSLAYIASDGGMFIANRKERLTARYDIVNDPLVDQNSLYFQASDNGTTGVYRNGERVTDYPFSMIRGDKRPLIQVSNNTYRIYRGDEILSEASSLKKPAVLDEGIVYSVNSDEGSVLKTPDGNITGYDWIYDYTVAGGKLAFIGERDQSYFLNFNGSESGEFSDTGYLRVYNQTPYFLASRAGKELLMSGHNVHTNLNERDKPEFFGDEEREYEYVEKDGETFIRYIGDEYGPFNKTAEVEILNDSLIVVERDEDSEYLHNGGRRYGPYREVRDFTVSGSKLFFVVRQHGQIRLKSVEGKPEL